MKKAIILTGLILAAGLIIFNYSTFAHGGNMTHRNHFWGNGWGMGCGMMGMMNSGMMMNHNCWNRMQNMQSGRKWNQPLWKDLQFDNYGNLSEPLSKDQTKILAESYIEAMGNPRLKLGQITDKGDSFEFSLVTKDGSLVEKYVIDKQTAWINSLMDE